MKILIVSKSRFEEGLVLGGLDENNRFVRLLDAPGTPFGDDAPYQVGQLWEMNLEPGTAPDPPHVEDVRVQEATLLETVDSVLAVLKDRVTPWEGGIRDLYQGEIRFTRDNRGYIERPTAPERSTWFWVTDKTMFYITVGNRSFYAYGPHDRYDIYDMYEVDYAGQEPAIAEIPKGTWVQVALTRWWKGITSAETHEERCELRVMAWYT